MDSDIDEWTLAQSAQFLDEVELCLQKIGRSDLSLALNKAQQDAGIQNDIISRDGIVGEKVESATELFSESEEAALMHQNFEPVTKDRLNSLFSEIAPLLSDDVQRTVFLNLSDTLDLNLNFSLSSPVLTAPLHPTMP